MDRDRGDGARCTSKAPIIGFWICIEVKCHHLGAYKNSRNMVVASARIRYDESHERARIRNSHILRSHLGCFIAHTGANANRGNEKRHTKNASR